MINVLKYFLSVTLLFLIFSFFFYKDNKKEINVVIPPKQLYFLNKPIIYKNNNNNIKHIQTPENVRAIYMSSWVASSKELRSDLINFINKSRINSVVLDIKDYSGVISFEIDHPLIKAYGTSTNRIADIKSFIDYLHDNNIYIIGRVTVFQDPLLASVKTEFAFKRKDNKFVWKDKKGLAFINPKNKDVWEYYTVIAEESYNMGFDEINFDYIRYPSDGDISNIDYSMGGETKLEIMKGFYKFLDERLRKQKKIPISADLFGLTASSSGGLNIGQNLIDALPYFDALCLMVYPSHYPENYLGFENPAKYPYNIVFHEMSFASQKVINFGSESVSLRTWIQDFDLGSIYGIKEINDQIIASYDAGVFSYMVWDPKNIYTKSAFYDNLIKEYEI